MTRPLKQTAAGAKTRKKPGLRAAVEDVLFERDRLEMAAVDRVLAPFTERRAKSRGRPSSRSRVR